MKLKRILPMLVCCLLASLNQATPLFAKSASGKGALQGVLNLNTATVEQLTLLPGIGPAKAQMIAGLRTSHPFTAVSELGEVKGIGPKLLEKLTPYLAVVGDNNLHTVEVVASEAPPAEVKK